MPTQLHLAAARCREPRYCYICSSSAVFLRSLLLIFKFDTLFVPVSSSASDESALLLLSYQQRVLRSALLLIRTNPPPFPHRPPLPLLSSLPPTSTTCSHSHSSSSPQYFSPITLSLLSTFLSLHYSYISTPPPLMHLLSLFPSPSTS